MTTTQPLIRLQKEPVNLVKDGCEEIHTNIQRLLNGQSPRYHIFITREFAWGKRETDTKDYTVHNEGYLNGIEALCATVEKRGGCTPTIAENSARKAELMEGYRTPAHSNPFIDFRPEEFITLLHLDARERVKTVSLELHMKRSRIMLARASALHWTQAYNDIMNMPEQEIKRITNRKQFTDDDFTPYTVRNI